MRIGIDIGGTKAVIACVDENAGIVRKERVSTGSDVPCKQIVSLIAQKARALSGGEAIHFVGIGIPGTVDESGQIAVHAPNLAWTDEPVAAYFADACGIMPYLAQDTRAAAWAEARTAEMKEKRCVACVTLGTGIGCGIVLGKRILHGALGTAGEIGHIPVVPDGRHCACGRQGCMEAYASGIGIARTARERKLCDTAEAVFTLAKAGNGAAQQLLAEAIGYAAQGITAMINVLSPEAVLFSGGMSAQRELFVEPLIARIRAMVYQSALANGLYMGLALLGEDAPVIGAAFLDESIGGSL